MVSLESSGYTLFADNQISIILRLKLSRFQCHTERTKQGFLQSGKGNWGILLTDTKYRALKLGIFENPVDIETFVQLNSDEVRFDRLRLHCSITCKETRFFYNQLNLKKG